ncbi:MAG: helix-turn-helix transcriptional regulator [Ignavibacteriae bacterium]|nr:helix-turn-helix transcriptional regulator [Ignavibacteriota bacterium]
MKNNKIKIYKFDHIKDEFIGKKGTPEREEYEFELKTELLGETIKSIRISRNLTQEQLGKIIKVQKSQISKLESGAKNVTVETILKIFDALKMGILINVFPKTKKKKVA